MTLNEVKCLYIYVFIVLQQEISYLKIWSKQTREVPQPYVRSNLNNTALNYY